MKGEAVQNAPIERIRQHLVGLRMPRALETLDHLVQQIERGQLGAIEAIELLLAEEITIRESRRIKAALQMARLGSGQDALSPWRSGSKRFAAAAASISPRYLSVGAGAGNLSFQLANARYERGAMILTSNRGFSEWRQVFGDPVIATALRDRLLHHAVIIQIEGSSYRLRHHADLLPAAQRASAVLAAPPARRRGRPPRSAVVSATAA